MSKLKKYQGYEEQIRRSLNTFLDVEGHTEYTVFKGCGVQSNQVKYIASGERSARVDTIEKIRKFLVKYEYDMKIQKITNSLEAAFKKICAEGDEQETVHVDDIHTILMNDLFNDLIEGIEDETT